MNPLEVLKQRETEIRSRLDGVLTSAETESRGLTDEEDTEVRGLTDELKGNLDRQATLVAAQEARARQGAVVKAEGLVPAGRTELRTEPYAKGSGESYFVDLHRAMNKGERAAIDRLVVNDRYIADKESRAMSTTAGAGGEFAPPLWQVADFVGYLRPGRPLVNVCHHNDLPAGVSSINLPKVSLGSQVAVQSSQNSAINERDFQTTSVSTGITTVAGQVIISQQDIDQTPINLDEIVLKDLANDYSYQTDLLAITAVTGVSGLNAVTYTDASPTSAKVLAQVQAGIDQVHLGVYRPAQAVVMRPDRWGRFLAATDSTGRPLVLPNAEYGAYNVAGMGDGPVPQGTAGTLRGVPSILDASIPVNLGAGTNQDEIIVFRPDEIEIFESSPKAETFQQTYANQLSVLVRFYAYWGVIANRLPKAISVITGTGMIPGTYGA